MSELYEYKLCGFSDGNKYSRPLNNNEIRNLRFPVAAFKAFCAKKGIPYPFEMPLNQPSKSEQETETVKTLSNEKGIEVIEGLTVGELREYLTDSSDEYLPRLLAVLRAKQRIIQERESRDSVGFKKFGTAKNPLKTLAENLVVEELKKVGINNVSDTDKKAVSRILLKEINPPTGQGGTY